MISYMVAETVSAFLRRFLAKRKENVPVLSIGAPHLAAGERRKRNNKATETKMKTKTTTKKKEKQNETQRRAD